MEDLSRDLEGRYDRTQAFVQENNGGSTTRSVTSAFDCNATVSLLQARRVVFQPDKLLTLAATR